MEKSGRSSFRTCGIVLATLVLAGSGCSTAARYASQKPSHDYVLQERVNRIGRELSDIAAYRGIGADVKWSFAAYVSVPSMGSVEIPAGIVRVDAAFARLLPDDELAALLAHEIAHMLLQHDGQFNVTSILVEGGTIVVAAIVFPWWGVIPAVIGVEASRELVIAGNDRSREEGADAVGLLLLCTAGYPGDAMVRELSRYRAEEIMHAWEEQGGWFDNYPSLVDRIANVRALIPTYCHGRR